MQKVVLRDYAGMPVPIEIQDNVEFISGVIISGDMVMKYPFYKNSNNTRTHNFYDGTFSVSKKNFEKMNSLQDSYEIQKLD